MPSKQGDSEVAATEKLSGNVDVATIACGALLAILLYMVGMLLHRLIGLPAPVGMLFAAVAVQKNTRDSLRVTAAMESGYEQVPRIPQTGDMQSD